MIDDEEKKIVTKNVTKRFELETSKKKRRKELLTPFRKKEDHSFWSLKGVTFDVEPGEAVGVVGLNGSGKSTLLNIVSGIYPQTTGELQINGDTSIISIGAGLKENLSGRDNIDFKLLMMGFTNSQVKEVMPDIIEFSELGDFIDQPVKTYSSGMKSKLGFSIMAHTNPDIMIIDEALSVGDSTFASKSFDKIREFKKQGKTIFFVSHSNNQVKEIADRVLWMHYGELRENGPADVVMPHYIKWQKEFNALPRKKREKYMAQRKKLQRDFSVQDIAEAELREKLEESNPDPKLTESRKARAEFVTKESKKLSKRSNPARLGWVNLFIVIALFFTIGYTAYTSVNNAEAQRIEAKQKKESAKKAKLASEKKASEKKKSEKNATDIITSENPVVGQSQVDSETPAASSDDSGSQLDAGSQENTGNQPDTNSQTDTGNQPDSQTPGDATDVQGTNAVSSDGVN